MPSKKLPTKPKPNTLTVEWSFEAIGTHIWIGLYEPCSAAELQTLQQAVARRIEAFDATYSRFRADSLVTQLAQQAGSYTFPADAESLFRWYRELYDYTAGQVTPLIGQLLADAGYDASYSLEPKSLQPVPAWDEVLTITGTVVTTTQPVLLDFGAAGKGYLVDLLCELLQAQGRHAFCIDAGGDMRTVGVPDVLRIGLEHPDDATQAIGVALLPADRALCGSSGSRRAWQGFTHIMNPTSLASATHIAAVWVLAKTTMIADGLTTALYFAEPAQLQRTIPFEYVIMYSNGSVQSSAGFPVELFTS